MLERTDDGQRFRILNVIDEYTRECLAMRAARQLDDEDLQDYNRPKLLGQVSLRKGINDSYGRILL